MSHHLDPHDFFKITYPILKHSAKKSQDDVLGSNRVADGCAARVGKIMECWSSADKRNPQFSLPVHSKGLSAT